MVTGNVYILSTSVESLEIVVKFRKLPGLAASPDDIHQTSKRYKCTCRAYAPNTGIIHLNDLKLVKSSKGKKNYMYM